MGPQPGFLTAIRHVDGWLPGLGLDDPGAVKGTSSGVFPAAAPKPSPKEAALMQPSPQSQFTTASSSAQCQPQAGSSALKTSQSAADPAPTATAASMPATAASKTADSKQQASHPAGKPVVPVAPSASAGQALDKATTLQQQTKPFPSPQPVQTKPFPSPQPVQKAASSEQVQRQAGMSKGSDANKAAAERVRKVLDLFPSRIPLMLRQGAIAKLSPPSKPCKGWEHEPDLLQAVNGKLAVIEELGEQLHERKSKLQAGVDALKLAQHLQAPLFSCLKDCEEPLTLYRVQQGMIMHSISSNKPEHGLDALNAACAVFKKISADLAVCEKQLQDMLSQALNVVRPSCLKAIVTRAEFLGTWAARLYALSWCYCSCGATACPSASQHVRDAWACIDELTSRFSLHTLLLS